MVSAGFVELTEQRVAGRPPLDSGQIVAVRVVGPPSEDCGECPRVASRCRPLAIQI